MGTATEIKAAAEDMEACPNNNSDSAQNVLLYELVKSLRVVQNRVTSSTGEIYKL